MYFLENICEMVNAWFNICDGIARFIFVYDDNCFKFKYNFIRLFKDFILRSRKVADLAIFQKLYCSSFLLYFTATSDIYIMH